MQGLIDIDTTHSALKRHSLLQEAREELSVAFSNKVIDTRDWHSQQGVPPKYDVFGWCLERLFSTFCKFFKYPSPGAKAPLSPARGEVIGEVV